jgi:oligopeptidase B
VTLDDPWHWLRDPGYPQVTDADVLAFLEAENAYFESVMGPLRALTGRLFEEIKGRIKEDDRAVPWRKNGYDYQWSFDEGSQYRVWSRVRAGGTDFETLLDENREAQGLEYFRLRDLEVSPDTRLLAYSVDTSGGERFEIRVKDLASGELLPDRIEQTDGSVAWSTDSRAFLYTVVSREWRPYQVRLHRLGTDPAGDPVIYEERDESFFVHVEPSSSERYILIRTADHVTSEVHVVSADDPAGRLRVVAPRRPRHDYYIDHGQGRFYVLTNDTHRNFRLASVAEGLPAQEHWDTLIAGSDHRYLTGVQVFRDFVAVPERIDGLEQIRIIAPDGDTHHVRFPETPCHVSLGNNPEYAQSHLRLGYESMVSPDSVFDYDVAARRLALRKEREIPSGYDKERYVSERLLATARDGAKVPVSIVYRRDFPRDGTAPLHLYGYGAYGHGLTPSFSPSRLSLLDRGFAFAIAHVRGGDELGYHWYEDGKLDARWNTFKDFIDVARFLVQEGYASAGDISISGGSAGGELVGAAVNLAPELWRAAVLHVPFVDVLNTMLDPGLPLTPIEWPEWGNPIESKRAFELIRGYSPYDNIASRAYPPMLVTAGLNDPRVTYWEPAKWVAKLRHLKTDDNVLLLKTHMGAGHSGRSGRYEAIQEVAEEYTFLLMAFGLADVEP